jgi:RNA polymerase sigma-70 factor (family 1)
MREKNHTSIQEELFTSLFKEYAGRVFRFFRHQVKRDDLAEDLTQEVFVNIWKRKDELFKEEQSEEWSNNSLGAYLFVTARNHLYNHLEKALKAEQCLLRLEETGSSDQSSYYSHIEEEIAVKELKAEFGDILSSLSPQRKRAFELSREYNLSYYEIAHTMGIAPRTVEKHVSAALKTLRARMLHLTILLTLFMIW